MKTFLLILGVALFVLGIQDGIRLLMDSTQGSIFSWIPGDVSLYIALDIAFAIAGAILAGYTSRKPKTN
jgi:hypothetical protein